MKNLDIPNDAKTDGAQCGWPLKARAHGGQICIKPTPPSHSSVLDLYYGRVPRKKSVKTLVFCQMGEGGSRRVVKKQTSNLGSKKGKKWPKKLITSIS